MSAAAAKRTVLAAATLVSLIAVSVVGPAGGARAPSSRTDRTAPTPPRNPHVTEVTPTHVALAWEPSLDNVGVAGYYVYGDAGRTTVANPSYTVSSLGCGESAVVSVAAFDEARNPRTWLAPHRPAVGRQFSTQDLQQRGFASAITPDDGDPLAGLDLQRRVVEER